MEQLGLSLIPEPQEIRPGEGVLRTAGGLAAVLPQGAEGHYHSCIAALHVTGAAAKELAILDLPCPRIVLPGANRLRRYNIDVAVENDRRVVSVSWQRANDVWSVFIRHLGIDESRMILNFLNIGLKTD